MHVTKGDMDKECQKNSNLNATKYKNKNGVAVSSCESARHPKRRKEMFGNWTLDTLITMLFPEKTAASIGLKILWKG